MTQPSGRDPREALWRLGRDGTAELDAQGRLVGASPQLLDALGRREGEVRGKSVLELVHPDDRAAALELARAAADSGVGAELVLRLAHADGRWRWLELTSEPAGRDGTGSLWVGRDVTERVETEAALQAQQEAERRIAEVATELLTLSDDEFDAGMRAGLEKAAALANAERAQFFALDPEGRTIGAYHQWCGPGVPERDPGESLHDGPRHYPWSSAELMAGRLVHLPDCTVLPDEAEAERRVFEAEGVRSYLAIPIRHRGRPVGFLDFQRMAHARGWSGRERQRLCLMAEILASAWRRRRAAVQQQRSEARVQALTEPGRDAILEVDPAGRVLYSSPNAAALTGFEVEALSQSDFMQRLHPDDRPRIRDGCRRYVETGEARESDCFRVRHRDGSWRWLQSQIRRFDSPEGEPRLAVVLRDVTAQEQHREDLEQQLEAERRLTEFSQRFLDPSAAEIDEAIRAGLEAAARLVGADRAFLVSSLVTSGPHAFDWHDEGVPPRPDPLGLPERPDQQYVEERLRRGEAVRVPDVEALPDAAGASREAMLRSGVRSFLGIPLLSDGRLVGVLGLHSLRQRRDWSDQQVSVLTLVVQVFRSALQRKRAEEQLRRSQEKLLQSQKLESLGTLAGGIAHDFNNQLTVILGNVRHALRDPSLAPDTGDALTDLERSAEHCANLTRSLLAFARRTAVKPQALDALQVVRSAVELIRPLMPTSIELRVDRQVEHCGVEADPTQLQQVLVNLAVNARDAMPDGGCLDIGIRPRRLDGGEAARLGLPAGGPFVELSVRDTGEGMDARVLARLFDPFFTTKAPGQGTGLGLATAYGIVRDSKGAIEVESRIGHGSVFRVLLPRSSRSETRPGAPGPRLPDRAATLLLAEDAPAVRRFAARALEARGYRVLQAGDGAAALELAERPTQRVDALLADVDMPRLSGVELARRLRRRTPSLPVLFLSGHESPDLTGPGAPVLDARFLGKPFAEEELSQAVAEMLGDERR